MISMKNMLFKLLCEQIEYRTIHPDYSGSLGLYFYEKKNIRKIDVDEFMKGF